ncbi:olfactory receptor 8I2-like [Hyla sarda]|uniref:olfactory receptor 8I2-like n=1 Tax=Hyla sarda TaxID=327740 RepID=UPI0024C35C0B|nr:olfactory receptor 8I2-like [Hyla sarda]
MPEIQDTMLAKSMSSFAGEVWKQTASLNKIYMNTTTIEYFVLKGFSDIPDLQILAFVAVLFVYLIIIGGNMTILILICLERHLHTPMYFFLANLSIVDISFTTSTLHKIFTGFMTGDRTVSFYGCMVQSFMSGSFTIHQLYILAAMSYDRYVAICIPLRYQMIMNQTTCVVLASLCWALGFLFISPFAWILGSFSCYTSIEVNHFFCDIVLLKKMTCSDTSLLDMLTFIEGSLLFLVSPFLLTFVPYIIIIAAILKIQTTTGRYKAFYTCSSHLTVVILLYTIHIIQYLIPSNLDIEKLTTLINTVVLPLLNPLIYSFKNKDIKIALRKKRTFWCYLKALHNIGMVLKESGHENDQIQIKVRTETIALVLPLRGLGSSSKNTHMAGGVLKEQAKDSSLWCLHARLLEVDAGGRCVSTANKQSGQNA